MRSTIFATIFLAASALARPMDTSAVEISLEVRDIKSADISIATVPTKRQIDLGDVTGIVTDLLGDVTDTLIALLPTITGTLNDLGAALDSVLANVESADLDSVLATVETTLEGIVDDVEAITAALGVDVSSELSLVESELNAAVTEAQNLLATVQSLIGLVSVTDTLTEVESLAAQLVDLLAGLL